MMEFNKADGIENSTSNGPLTGTEINPGAAVTGRADGRTVEPGYYAKLAGLGLIETWSGDVVYRDEAGQQVKAMPGKWD